MLCASASDQFIITHAPSYLHYRPEGGDLPVSEIPQLVKSTFGHSTKVMLSVLLSFNTKVHLLKRIN